MPARHSVLPASCLALALWTGSAAVRGDVAVVPYQYPTIQAAMEAVQWTSDPTVQIAVTGLFWESEVAIYGPMTIEGAPGNRPILVTSGQAGVWIQPTGPGARITLRNLTIEANDFTQNTIEFRNDGFHSVRLDLDRVTVTSRSHNAGVGVALTSRNGSSDIRITNSRIVAGNELAPGQSYGILAQLEDQSSLTLDTIVVAAKSMNAKSIRAQVLGSGRFTLRNSEVTMIPWEGATIVGVDVTASDMVIERNRVFLQVFEYPRWVQAQGIVFQNPPLADGSCRTALVNANFVTLELHTPFKDQKESNAGIQAAVSDCAANVSNNAIRGFRTGLVLDDQTALPRAGARLAIVNNTLFENRIGVEFRAHGGPVLPSSLRNNLVATGQYGVAVSSGWAPSPQIDTNGFFAQQQSNVYGAASTNEIVGDPLFSDPWELHLLPGSPMINRGVNNAIGVTTLDGDGLPRVRNGRIDLGAFEVQ
jgi:hypothetical protein